MADQSWDFFIQQPRVTVQTVPYGKQYHIVADVPVGIAGTSTAAVESLRPVKGTDISAVAVLMPFFGTTVTGIGVRVLASSYQQSGGPKMELHVYALQPIFVGSTKEIEYSRKTGQSGMFYTASNLWVTADGSTGLPTRGADYPGDSALNTLLRRKAKDIARMDDVIPGLYVHQVQYIGAGPLRSGGMTFNSTVELDARVTARDEDGGNKSVTTYHVSPTETALPARGTYLDYGGGSPDSGATGRVCVGGHADSAMIPSLYVLTCQWAGVIGRSD